MAITTAAAILGSAVAGGVGTAYAARKDAKANQKANDVAQQQRADSQAFIEREMERSRGELFKLFPSIQDTNQKGLAAGLDIYKQSIPLQLNTFKAGNMGAQQQLVNALPQIQNAILGRRVDLSGIQPAAVNTGNLTMPQAPQFQQIGGLLGQIPPEVLAALASHGVQ